jgi:hypothetical protein
LTVPVAGNAYRSAPDPFFPSRRREESLQWNDAKEVYSLYFHVDRACELKLALEAKSSGDSSELQAIIGQKSFDVVLDKNDFTSVDVGGITVDKPGYLRVDLKGKKSSGKSVCQHINRRREADMRRDQ